MNFNKRLFAVLWLPGMAGICSTLLLDFSALVASLPIPPGTEVPEFTPALKLLSLIQPGVILTLAVLGGCVFAPKVGLTSPVAEAVAAGKPFGSALQRQVVPGLVGGLAGGLAIIGTSWLARPFLPADTVARIAEWGRLLPFPTRLLYGGFTEELLLRWGLMTVLVWAAWRLFQKGEGEPKPGWFVAAIFVSSFIFGIGHLAIAFVLIGQLSLVMMTFVIVANSSFGIIAGYLYWKKGLESAMLAHMVTHAVLWGASYLGAYF